MNVKIYFDTSHFEYDLQEKDIKNLIDRFKKGNQFFTFKTEKEMKTMETTIDLSKVLFIIVETTNNLEK